MLNQNPDLSVSDTTATGDISKTHQTKESNTVDDVILTDITLDLSYVIRLSKAKYYERLAVKLNYPKTAPKLTYWSILKIFVNGPKIITKNIRNRYFLITL